jgi:hypothetical protein
MKKVELFELNDLGKSHKKLELPAGMIVFLNYNFYLSRRQLLFSVFTRS